MRWAGSPLRGFFLIKAGCSQVSRTQDRASRPESTIVELGAAISLCNRTCDFFQSLSRFLFQRLFFFFSGGRNPARLTQIRKNIHSTLN